MTDKNRHHIRLETERLVLRKPVDEDARRIAELIGDYEISKNTGRVPYPYDLKDAEKFMTSIEENWGFDQYNFALCLKEDDGQLIGLGGPFNLQSARVELGYFLGKSYWGRGLMSEAVLAMVDLVFDRINAPFLLADHHIGNPASGRVLEKCGFREFEKRALYSFARGKFVPGRCLRIKREDWQQNRIMEST